MTDIHAQARAHEDPAGEGAAIEWIDEEIATRTAERGASGRIAKGADGPQASTEDDLFTREFVVEAFLAGRAQSWLIATLGRAAALLQECASLFRTYEEHHKARAHGYAEECSQAVGHRLAAAQEDRDASLAKAERNHEIASRLEAFLIDPDTPRDRVGALALSLVQDLGELMAQSSGVFGLHLNHDPAPWDSLTAGGQFEDWLSSYDRLRDALDAAFPVKGELVARREPGGDRIGDNPAEVMRWVATHVAKSTGLKVDHASFDQAAAQLDEPVVLRGAQADQVIVDDPYEPTVPGEAYSITERWDTEPDGYVTVIPATAPNVRPVTAGPLAEPGAVDSLIAIAAGKSARPTIGLEQTITHPDPRFDVNKPVRINGYPFEPVAYVGRQDQLQAALEEALAMVESWAAHDAEGFTSAERERYDALYALCHGTSDTPATEA